MRALVSKGVVFFGVICAIAAAVWWAYFIWTNDWGRFGTRGWGLWMMGFTIGPILIFLFVGFVGTWVASLVDPDAF